MAYKLDIHYFTLLKGFIGFIIIVNVIESHFTMKKKRVIGFHSERILGFMLDTTDLAILNLLKENSRRQWREIGELVHLTGQAVAMRIRRMEELGIIEGYTVKLNNDKLGKPLVAFITVFMKDTNHASFQTFIKQEELIMEVHRISGEGCYWLKAQLRSQVELNHLLNKLLLYGNYRLNLSIDRVK